MISAEEKIGEILSQVPDITDANGKTFKVRFNWGSENVLNKFITMKESQSKYPLIWLILGKAENEISNSLIQCKPRLVIATRSDKADEFNPFIYQTDFKTILNPIAENVLKALERSGVSTFTKYDIERKANYSQNMKEGVTVDIWNAIVLDIKDLVLRSDRCINNIKF